ncbi:hypothetical protein PV10_03122 [Exophiala mesophila]|uniref:dipeptidyl-peptidase IV n=1 Tax=Exophiala mesophila TaxID=212818 RepID=A0A0D2A923_EXOME|nr:uncharacterized protein PV10_03122 [Exophiala mesophila]KIV95468.1 hypothetical protein PV10_03122 [Exophiala mesophila]
MTPAPAPALNSSSPLPSTSHASPQGPRPLQIITTLRSPDFPVPSPRKRRSVAPSRDKDLASAVSTFTLRPPCVDSGLARPHLDNRSQSTSTSLPFKVDIFRAGAARQILPYSSMARVDEGPDHERERLIDSPEPPNVLREARRSQDSISSISTTSLVLENLNSVYSSKEQSSLPSRYRDDDSDPELPSLKTKDSGVPSQHMSNALRRAIWIVSVVAVIGWAFAILIFISGGRYKHSSTLSYDAETPVKSTGKKVTLEQIQSGQWSPRSAPLSWIAGPNGEDGLLLEYNRPGQDFIVIEDIRNMNASLTGIESKTLQKSGWITVDGERKFTDKFWVSPDHKHVLIQTGREKVFRHSAIGQYYILNVESQGVEPLDPANPKGRVQLATWSPNGAAIVFTRDNNLFLRELASTKVTQITKDGGPEYFYGIPDWVYEEEVFASDTATWWARDGKYVAFLRTNETSVPEYPVQFFVSRPSGKTPPEGLEHYPEVKQIKYPKAGAPNPTVDMLFYDIDKEEVFEVKIDGGFPDNDRIIYNVLWADQGKVLISESNRESDRVRILLVDVVTRSGQTVRTIDLRDIDGGWLEPTQHMTYIPADLKHGRELDGYVDTIISEDRVHLAYFSPLNTSTPLSLTTGKWEVDGGPKAVDLKNNIVYFIGTVQAPTQRHLYSVQLNGSAFHSLVPDHEPGYWDASFSSGSGYINLQYAGPGIPYQKVVSTAPNPEKIEQVVEDNKDLAAMAASHELPHQVFQNVTVDGVTLQVVERRPPHFDPKKKYPVLFYLYGGPGSQMVNRRFHVDFQSFIASSLGYIVVTVDGRGTGFIGRKARTIIRNELGKYEARDQIETAKMWAAKSYVDANRMAIWGWSYGGFMTLKVLETDAGNTFQYGMAVAPVTDWRFYDSIYTERYMRTPQHNPDGYDRTAISNVTALSQNVRFLIMHGVADDNVHMQNTLTLLDKFDLGGIENYDVHFFPDSDHSIYFHNANHIVYDKLSTWLINAFNGEWYRTDDPKPLDD